MDLDEYFSTGPTFERPIFDAVLGHLETLGPMQVEPVSVGIFIKSSGSFVELRPMTRWVGLWFPMTRRIHDPRIARKPVASGQRLVHVVNLKDPGHVDDQVQAWLDESCADLF